MQRTPKHQKGAVAILVAVMLIVLLGFGALTIDMGRAYVVKNELQNAADAAALNGARFLYPLVAKEPNWNAAENNTTTGCPNNEGCNTSESITLDGSSIKAGYWNLAGSYPQTLVTGTSPGTSYAPALEVHVKRMTGHNDGPINTFLAFLLDEPTMDVSVTATAVITNPGTVPPGALLPIAINKCMYDLYWDKANNKPYNATSATLSVSVGNGTVNIPQVVGTPWVIRIGSSYHYPGCEAGQWTSFTLDTNNTPDIRDLIANGNPDPLSVWDGNSTCTSEPGQCTYIQPGTKNTLFNEIPFPENYVIPVVDYPDLTVKGNAHISAFAPFRVTAEDNGSNPYVQGSFLENFTVPGSGGVGPAYGAYTPPRLAH